MRLPPSGRSRVRVQVLCHFLAQQTCPNLAGWLNFSWITTRHIDDIAETTCLCYKLSWWEQRRVMAADERVYCQPRVVPSFNWRWCRWYTGCTARAKPSNSAAFRTNSIWPIAYTQNISARISHPCIWQTKYPFFFFSWCWVCVETPIRPAAFLTASRIDASWNVAMVTPSPGKHARCYPFLDYSRTCTNGHTQFWLASQDLSWWIQAGVGIRPDPPIACWTKRARVWLASLQRCPLHIMTSLRRSYYKMGRDFFMCLYIVLACCMSWRARWYH